MNEAKDPELAAFESYMSSKSSDDSIGIGWGEILGADDSVIILGEPGSGKTQELRAQTAKLMDKGLCAAFIELGQMVNALAPPLSQHHIAALARWRNGTADAWLFLDAVDESKLIRASDFRAALQRVASWVGSQRERTRYVISSRISEWRLGTDDDWVENDLLVAVPRRLRRLVSQSNTLGADRDGTPRALTASESSKGDRKLRVLKLLPLTPDQVIRFLKPSGGDPRPFLEEIERIDALDFVGRPEDARDLYALWREHGSIGTKAEMLEQSTTFKLRLKEDRSGMSPVRLREGAEDISACMHLSRRLYILVEEDHGDMSADSVLLRACLPQDWSHAERRTLIQRALFDGATFNRVRLHHRTHQDYLTACWLRGLMEAECPYAELRQLVFDEHGDGRLILRPFMGSVAAWLVCISKANLRWVQAFMTNVLDHAPWIFLSYGDPQSLPIDYRRDVLRHIVERFRDRSYVQVDWDATTLKRFAAPELSGDLAIWIGDPSTSIDIRADYVMLVRHGHLHGAMQPVVAIAVDSNAEEYLRATALGCIARIGSNEQKLEVFKAAQAEVEISLRMAGWIAMCVYPAVADETGLFGILGNLANSPARYSTSSLDHFEREVIATGEGIADERIGRFLDALVVFLRDSAGELRRDRAWAVDWLYPLIARLLDRSALSVGETKVILDAIALHTSASELQLTNDWRSKEKPSLNDLSLAHPAMRRAWFWRQYDVVRGKHKEELVHLYQIHQYDDGLTPHADDQHWWFDDVLSQTEARQVFALRAGLSVRRYSNTFLSRWPPVKVIPAMVRHRSLRRVVWHSIASNVLAPWYRLRQQWEWHWQRRYYWENKWRPVKDWYWDIFNKCHLLLNHRRIAAGKWWNACNFVVERTRHSVDNRSHSKWGGLGSSDIDRQYGPLIGQAVRAGLDKHWREFWPPLPHEKLERSQTSAMTVHGLVALDVGWSAQGDAYFAQFTAEEANRATRYALNELNGLPDWLASVTERHLLSVQSVLNKAINGEWNNTPVDAQFGSDTLSRLAWDAGEVPRLAVPVTRALLQGSIAANLNVLTQALRVVAKHDTEIRAWLPTLARERIAESAHTDQAAWVWLTILIQFDADMAFDILERWVETLVLDEASEVAVNVCAALTNRRDGGITMSEPDYLRPRFLARFIPWVYRHVRPEKDPIHEGAYSPTPRDEAARFRSQLIEILVNSDAADTEEVLHQLADLPELVAQHDWLVAAVDRRRARLADTLRLHPSDVFELRDQHERPPRSRADLFHIAFNRILAFKDQVERSESSIRHEVLLQEWKEKNYQNWIKQHLDAASRGRYTLPAEAEIDPGKFPDLRFEHPDIDGAISVEVKVADEWSHRALTEALQGQLVDQYLRAPNANYGIYLLFHNGKKPHWEPDGQSARDWKGLLTHLKTMADQLRESRLDIEHLVVIGIDVTKPRI
jgi:hypothetical protein